MPYARLFKQIRTYVLQQVAIHVRGSAGIGGGKKLPHTHLSINVARN